MISTIILIVAFQLYWITRLYNTEWQNLQKETDVVFRDVVYKLQLQRFRNDTALFKKGVPDNLFVLDVIDSVRESVNDTVVKQHIRGTQRQIMISVNKRHDSINDDLVKHNIDSLNLPVPPPDDRPRIVRFFSNNKTLNDTLSLNAIDSAYKQELLKNNITLPFKVNVSLKKNNEPGDTVNTSTLKTNFAFVGLSQARAYQAEFENPFSYILKKIQWQIFFSFLLITITILSFIFLYRNLLNQRRLAAIKNEFISNITHELKTPIATMHVAIEALRNFNAIQNPGRTKEYLDISASELQRLSLLVDNVLRLSMFENKAIELKKEKFDLYDLATQIVSTMKLRFDKAQANVTVERQGDLFDIDADKLHISSMLYNLLDNALKYSKNDPQIKIEVIAHKEFVELCVSDNGIGIAPEYREKIFEKFFRVPNESRHNAKGYGLGLSYVSQIAKQHAGFIEVKSELGKGSTFSVKLPYEEADVIHYGQGRVLRKIRLKL